MKQLIHLGLYSLCVCAVAVFTIGHTSPITLVTDVLAVIALVVSLWLAQRSGSSLPAVLALCGVSTLAHLPIGLWLTAIVLHFNVLSLGQLIAYYMLNTLLVACLFGYAITMYRNNEFFNLVNGSSNISAGATTGILALITIVVLVAAIGSLAWLRVSPVL